MDLKTLATEPKLKRIDIDAEDIIAEYGEPLTFYVYDRQPISTFIKLATNTTNDIAVIVDIVNSMIYDADGQLIVAEGQTLPTKIYMRVIEKVIAELGK